LYFHTTQPRDTALLSMSGVCVSRPNYREDAAEEEDEDGVGLAMEPPAEDGVE